MLLCCSSDEFAGLGIYDKYLYVFVDDDGVAPEEFYKKCQRIRETARPSLDGRVKVTKKSFLSNLKLDWYFSRWGNSKIWSCIFTILAFTIRCNQMSLIHIPYANIVSLHFH